MGNPADMPEPRQFSDLDTWFIGKPDLVVTMDKPYTLPKDGPDNIVDVLVDPGFTEDMYVMAIESKPADPRSFKVVHHFTTNLVEDPEEDPVGLFLNEYALGKNGDVFPPDSGRLIKAGTKINFNLHLNPRGDETPVSVKLGLKVYPKGNVPTTSRSRSTWATPPISTSRQDNSRVTTATSACRSRRSSHRSSHTCTTVARRSASKPSIPTCAPIPRALARPASRRSPVSATISSAGTSRIRTPTMSRRCFRRGRSCTYLLARQHDGEQMEPESEELGRLRAAIIDEMSFAWVTLTYLEQDDFDRRVAARRAQNEMGSGVICSGASPCFAGRWR